MLFQSYIFILLFFPLCLLGFWGLKRQKLLQLWLIAFSLWFYGAASPYYLLLLLGSIAWNYAFFRAIESGIGRVTERVSGSAMERAEYGMERDSSRKRLRLCGRKFQQLATEQQPCDEKRPDHFKILVGTYRPDTKC